MKSNLMNKALAALVLGGLGLMTASAHADWDRGNYGQGHSYGNHYRHVSEQSRMFGQQINARQNRQIERIHAGMRSGSLTRHEFRDLMHEQREIRALEQHFLADGFIDAREFQRLDRALDLASRNIKDEKHDRQERYAVNPYPRFN